MSVSSAAGSPGSAAALRIGGVSYLNAKPLLWGLEGPQVELTLDVPARLLDGLRAGRFDVALLPVIDYQRMAGLRLLHAGAIGSDGPALTVRIFSRVPIERIESLACDPDSHTSVVLARIMLAERHDIRPRLLALAAGADADALLLIGDKVVCEPPRGFSHELDLGEAWKALTGLPFVFAAWMARQELADHVGVAARLNRALEEGLAHLPEIVRLYAVPRGWPADVAMQYLTQNMDYRLGPPQVEAIRRFFALAKKHALIDRARPI
jgi:chorismate dehydratase